MSDDKPTDRSPAISRRKLLTRTGSSGVGLAGLSAVVSAQRKGPKPNTNFNPDRENQVKRFVQRLRTLSEEDRFELSAELSREQQRAVFEGLQPERIEVEHDAPSTAEPTDTTVDSVTAQSTRASRTTSVRAYSTLGFLLWRFHHEVIWNYDGNRVTNITSNAYPTNVDPTWEYIDISSKYLRNEGSYFDAFKQGQFRFCAVGGYFCGFNTYPYIEWRGRANGSATVLRSSCDC